MQKVSLTQTQRQQIKLSPQQRLKIKILQLSNLQLIEAIKEELLQNPVLEEEDTSTLQLPIVDLPSIKENDKQDEINWEDFFESSRNPLEKESYRSEFPSLFDNIPTQQPTLREYLLQQLRMLPLSNKEYEIGELIIDNLNEDGYFYYGVDKIADEAKVSTTEVENILSKIQEFDPSGIGAKDLKECLLIQVKELKMEDAVATIIKNYLPLIQSKNYEEIAKQMNISLDRVKELVELVGKSLEPKPARLYERFQGPWIMPEIIISNTEEEGWKLELNDEWIPTLRISPYYQRLLKEKKLSPAENEYIQKKMKAALFFLECMEKRKRTLKHVAQVIFETQKEFLQQGVHKLVPMKLGDIAKEVNLHLSTVSRAIADKFVKTPHGIFPLKFFFKTGLETKDGFVSIITIKEKIKGIIEQEDKQHPFSDGKISALLQQQGINIAPRTVSKYREELKILSSFVRKRIRQ